MKRNSGIRSRRPLQSTAKAEFFNGIGPLPTFTYHIKHYCEDTILDNTAGRGSDNLG